MRSRSVSASSCSGIDERSRRNGDSMRCDKLTVEVLENIRHLNALATSMRAGLVDIDEAAAEIDLTEDRLHELIDRLRPVAGVER